MFILIGVNILGSFLAITRLPSALAEIALATAANKYFILFLIVCMYLILGCMMNVLPLLLLTLPAIFPTVVALGFDPVWFGVVTVLLMEMGLITPPVGMVVFGISGLNGAAPIMEIFRYVLPFVIAMLIGVLILTIFPGIATFLPNALM
jgi:TRAP-type C4-dicarboxylate transport system permease large subunit